MSHHGDRGRRLTTRGPVVTLDDIAARARRRLPREIFEVIAGGNGDDLTTARNSAAYDRIALWPHPLVDTTTVDLRTNVLGQGVSMPVLLAPCSFARLCHPVGETGIARAAGQVGIEYVVPGGVSERPEVVAAAATGPLWYQLYLSPDRDATVELIRHVKASGYRVLCVTVDTPRAPWRVTDRRNRVTMPIRISPQLIRMGASRPRWAKDFLVGGGGSRHSITDARSEVTRFSRVISGLRPVTIADLHWIRELWDGPLVVKGVLRADGVDAVIDAGVDGIVVSNHGGRNLDTTPASIEALPSVVRRVVGRAEVLVDGGIRRGTDVVKALARGARAVLIGRPYLYGLAVAGESGVVRVAEILRNELEYAMVFSGARTVSELDGRLLG